jgi:hypothetical protein
VNPFVFVRCELSSPREPEVALGGLERVVREGFDAEGRRYRLFGGRRGRAVTMSLGMPVFGGGAPILRAWLLPEARPTTFEITIGARLEVMALAALWALLTALGGGWQLVLQLREVLAGRAGWSAVTDVLPGIGVMAGILALGWWLLRRRSRLDSVLLLAAFRDAVGAPPESGPALAAAPLP